MPSDLRHDASGNPRSQSAAQIEQTPALSSSKKDKGVMDGKPEIIDSADEPMPVEATDENSSKKRRPISQISPTGAFEIRNVVQTALPSEELGGTGTESLPHRNSEPAYPLLEARLVEDGEDATVYEATIMRDSVVAGGYRSPPPSSNGPEDGAALGRWTKCQKVGFVALGLSVVALLAATLGAVLGSRGSSFGNVPPISKPATPPSSPYLRPTNAPTSLATGPAAPMMPALASSTSSPTYFLRRTLAPSEGGSCAPTVYHICGVTVFDAWENYRENPSCSEGVVSRCI